MTSIWERGLCLEICCVFADYIVFKQQIYCLFLQTVEVKGIKKFAICSNRLTVSKSKASLKSTFTSKLKLPLSQTVGFTNCINKSRVSVWFVTKIILPFKKEKVFLKEVVNSCL